MSGKHAFLPPSGAGAWQVCAMWPTMTALYPEAEDKPEAMEGDAAHWACAQTLAGVLIDVGLIAPNGVTLTDEMIEGAELYFDAVQPSGDERVEQHVTMPSIHAQNDGTPDAWAFAHDPTTGIATLFIWDYKFGHDFVEVFENWQLIDYAAGILDQLGIDGAADQHIKVRMTIVQPRSYHRDGPVRSWSVMASDLRPYFNKLRAAAEAATSAQPVATVDPVRACKHCPGRHACEAFQRAAYTGMDVAIASAPLELSAHALGLELRMIQHYVKVLTARATGLEEQALATIRRGQSVPFFGVEQSTGREAWTRPIEEVIALGDMMGVKLARPDVLTPKQAIKAGLPAEIVAPYADTPRGAMKLVPDNGTQARRIFSY